VNCTGIILAGGRSSRFGSNKALAELHGKKLIEHVISVMRAVFDEVVIVTNQPEQYKEFGCKVLKDIIPDLGPVGGIATAFKYTDKSAIFVTACDMPFISADAINNILSQAESYSAVVARSQNGMEPLFALYKKDTLKHFEEGFKKDDRSVLSILKQIKQISFVDIGCKVVTNINTINDHAEL
jgi:molybdopterin-guanine dinucleotide biosynthesis protein A